MNILASYDWLKQYVDLGAMTAEEFATRVSLSGPGVERLYPQGADLDRVVLGRVLEVKPHPNADKLRLAVTDLGDKNATIVCGGSNLSEGQWVAVAKEGAMVRRHGEGEPIELKPAEIRGVKSEGMICAANEIGLFDAFPHGEREILDVGVALGFVGARRAVSLRAGTPLVDALGLNAVHTMHGRAGSRQRGDFQDRQAGHLFFFELMDKLLPLLEREGLQPLDRIPFGGERTRI